THKPFYLIAEKRHETYQDVQGVKHHFSDFEIAQLALEKGLFIR
ncbi:hypothetical protein, partial [Kingella kingae]